VTFLVAVLEQFRPNNAVTIDQECAGVWDTVPLRIADPVSFDRPVAGVGQQRVRDVALAGEVGQGISGVVADGDKFDTGIGDLRQVGLQLDQLLLAERSPPRRAKKDNRHGPFLPQLVERLFGPRLVLEREGRCSGADRQTRLGFGRWPTTSRAGCGATRMGRRVALATSQQYYRHQGQPG
jgi:hypothetical protein